MLQAPAHGTLSGSAPNLVYTRAANYHGVDAFIFKANDGGLNSALATVAITVTPVNHAPSAQPQITTTAEDTTLPIVLVGSDSDGDALTIAVIDAPTHGTLSGRAPNFVYAPAANYHGSDLFTFRVNDGTLDSAPATIAISVTPINDAALATPETLTTTEDTALPVVLNGNDTDGDALAFAIIDAPTHGTLSGSAPNLIYTPAANYYGADAFTFRVNDGSLDSAPANTAITVTPVNDAPSAQSQSLEVDGATPLPIALTGTDPDGDALTYAVDAAPAHGSLSGAAPNFVYTAIAGYSGEDSFTFRSHDGQLDSTPARIEIGVLLSNPAPEIVSTPVMVATQAQSYRYDVDATDPENDTLVYSLDRTPHALGIDAASGVIEGVVDASLVQPVRAFNSQCYVIPDELLPTDGAFITPLHQRVRVAITKGSRYVAPQAVAWDRGYGCLGCHVQNQALLGLQGSMDRAEVDEAAAEYLLAGILSSQQADGSIRRSDPEYSRTQTALALWALSYVPDRARTLVVRERALRFFLPLVQTSGNRSYWTQDRDAGWIRGREGITVVLALSINRYLRDISRLTDVTAAQVELGLQLRALLPGVAEDFLSQAATSPNNLALAFAMLGLAEVAPHLDDSALRARVDVHIAQLDTNLRARAYPGGGWNSPRSFNVDSITSAWVGFALDTQNPPPTDPVVLRNIKFLLATQRVDGSWDNNSFLFATLLGTTSLVMAYLPVALEHLGNPDLTLGHMKLAPHGDGYVLSVDAINRGLADVTVASTVTFFAGREASGTALGTASVAALRSGESRWVSITLDELPAGDVSASIHAAGIEECLSDNNATRAALTIGRATDPQGLFDTQAWLINLNDANAAPVITSQAVTSFEQGKPYVYQVTVSDADVGDAHEYGLTTAPAGLYIDPLNGRFRYDLAALASGTHAVSVRVTDLRGASAQQSFQLTVVPNHPPRISSTPGLQASVGATYRYDVDATDPDNDTLRYRLDGAPLTMNINAETGVITWTPGTPHVGNQSVAVVADDGRGGRARQVWTITVTAAAANQPPSITSTPYHHAKVGREYRYALVATDPNGDPLTYSLTTAPSGMTIAANGAIAWTPSTTTGAFPVRVRVADAQEWVEQAWTITVIASDVSLNAEVSVTPNPVQPGAPLTLQIAIVGAAGPPIVSATLDGQPIALDADGSTTVTAPTAPGPHEIVVTVNDGHDTDTTTTPINVADSSDTTPPGVSLILPAEHADWDAVEVTAPTAVTGFVTGADTARWTLALQERGSTATRLLAEGTGEFTEREIATFDPTTLLNGLYVLVLQAQDSSGNLAYASRLLRVTGDMKLGHFSLSFEEITIPVAGIPVTVTRSYDTRRADQSLDFGYGWTVDANNVRLQESRRVGFAWDVFIQGGTFGQRCIRPLGDPIVTVTLPDGEVASFKARAEPECRSALDGDSHVSLLFDPIEGTDHRLEQTDYGIVRWANIAGNAVGILFDEASGDTNPIDPRHYRLTTDAGLVYEVDQFDGVRTITDQGTETSLTYSRDGVQHSSGIGIDFIRDAQSRITQLRLPDGETIDYRYTASGDLEAMIDQEQEETRFTYEANPRYPHYLRDIVDPRGIRVSRNEYDEDGRLVATIDADGHRIEFTHALAARTQTIKDRRGNRSTLVFDEAGRVLSQTNAEGETVTRTYDAEGNTLTETDPLAHTTTRTFDAHGNVETETNPLDETTTHTYNAKNQLLTQTDAAERTVISNTYDPRSNQLLLRSTDALGQATGFGYLGGTGAFGSGQLETITDAALTSTGFGYDGNGYTNRTTDALGHATHTVNDEHGRMRSQTTTRTVIAADGSTSVETLTTTYTLDNKGRVTATTHPDNSVTTTAYNGNDQPTRECDGLQRCTNTRYNDRGEVERIDYHDGRFETKTYDRNGNLDTKTDRAGRTTRFVYDKANRLTQTIHPDADADNGNDSNNPRSINRYDAAGRLEEGVDENQQVTRYGYDNANRRTQVIRAATTTAGEATTVDEYDVAGRRTASTDADSHRTEYRYDDAGRLIETIHADATPADLTDNPRIRTDYDAVGRKVADIDPTGRITRYAYDKLGRLTAVVLPHPVTGANPPLGNGESPQTGTLTTRYDYDEVGNKLRQTDAEGRNTRWEYDAMGRETARLLPEGQRETKQYNAAGELIVSVDFEGRTTTYRYDEAGRLEHIDHPNDADVSFGYNAVGERTTVTDGRGSSTMTFDRRSRMVQSHDADGGLIEYGHDDAGNLLSRISPSQSLVYTYDTRHRLETVTRTVDGEAPTVTRYEYDQDGNRRAMIGGDGLRTEYTYDRRHRLTDLVKKTAAGAMLLAMQYTVDANGMRTAVEERDAAGLTRVVAYNYDAVKRLTTETIDHRDNTRDRASAWTYDAVGNRLTQTVLVGATEAATTAYAYDANDRLLSESTTGATTTYTFDANGNTQSKTGPSGATTYRYDDANRLIEATTPQGVTAYVYNADGLRVRQTHTPIGGTATTTWYVLDSAYPYAQVIEEYTSEGAGPKTLAATFTFAVDLVSQTRYETGSPVTRFVQQDGFGSTRWLTDAVGAITDTIEYDAFGVEIARTGSTDTAHRYRGERFDANVGFYDLRARLYNPHNGRFLTEDSFGGFSMDPPSLHKYSYAHGDPTNNVDPSGHMSLMELGSNLNTLSNLYTVASTAFDLATGNYIGAAEGALDIVSAKFSFAGGAVTKLSKRAEALFARVWGSGKKLKVTGDPSSTVLGDNLGVIGFPRPPGAQAHHLIGKVTEFGKKSRILLADKFKIDVNSPLNGVWLPDCKGPVGVMTMHCGKHAEAYERFVFNRLSLARTRDEAIVALAEVRRLLIHGELNLNSAGVLP